MVSSKFEYASIQRGMERQSYEWGEVVDWYVYAGTTGEDTVYDEGGRHWKKARRLPVYNIVRVEGTEEDRTAGTYQQETVQIVVSPYVWKHRGLPPADAPDRVFDRIGFENKLYTVDSLQLRGRFGTWTNVYMVQATQVQPDETFYDDLT